MQTTAEPRSSAITMTLEPPVRGVLRCPASRSGGSQTAARVRDDVADQGARRLGTLAILTAVSVVVASILKMLLQLEMAAAHASPLFRLSALFLVLSSAGLAVLQRSGSVRPQILLDFGLAYEISGAFALAVMESAVAWPNVPIRGSTFVAAWIALCVLVIPNVPWKSGAAAWISACIV